MGDTGGENRDMEDRVERLLQLAVMRLKPPLKRRHLGGRHALPPPHV